MRHKHYCLLTRYLEDPSQPVYSCCTQTGQWHKLSLQTDLVGLFTGNWDPESDFLCHIGENPPKMLVVNGVLVRAGFGEDRLSQLDHNTRIWTIDSLNKNGVIEVYAYAAGEKAKLELLFSTSDDAEAMLEAILKPFTKVETP
jgi:hypothetical protein